MKKENAKVAPSKIYNVIKKMDERYDNPKECLKNCYLKRDDIICTVRMSGQQEEKHRN